MGFWIYWAENELYLLRTRWKYFSQIFLWVFSHFSMYFGVQKFNFDQVQFILFFSHTCFWSHMFKGYALTLSCSLTLSSVLHIVCGQWYNSTLLYMDISCPYNIFLWNLFLFSLNGWNKLVKNKLARGWRCGVPCENPGLIPRSSKRKKLICQRYIDLYVNSQFYYIVLSLGQYYYVLITTVHNDFLN